MATTKTQTGYRTCKDLKDGFYVDLCQDFGWFETYDEALALVKDNGLFWIEAVKYAYDKKAGGYLELDWERVATFDNR